MKTKKVLLVSSDEKKLNPLLRRRILKTARELFFKHGFLRITVDEIASELGISKATLYKYFSSKEALLAAIIGQVKSEISSGVEHIIRDKSTDFLEKLVGLMTFIGSWLSRIDPALIRDLRKSASDLWEDIDRFRREKILSNFKGLIDAGVREDVFQGDINQDLMVRMYLNLVQDFINPEMLLGTGCSAQEIFETLIRVFFEGILTDRSRKEFSKRKTYLEKLNKEVT